MQRVRGFILGSVVVTALGGLWLSSTVTAQSKEAGFVDRLYILNGGIGRAGNASDWLNMTVPAGTPIDIGAPAHLIKHGDTWMLFDTSTNDTIATMPNGFGAGENGIRWIKTAAQTLAPQLKAVGVAPDDIKYIGISHNHADHTGNVYQFQNSEVLIQRREYDFMFAKGGAPAGPPSFRGQIFERNHAVKLLDGDYDVFGDGSVLLFYVGGHTLGSQICLVHLKSTGYVLLSGDAVHLRSNFDTRRIPRVGQANDENEWLWSVPLAFERIAALMNYYKAQLWVHHDVEDYKARKLAPQYYE